MDRDAPIGEAATVGGRPRPATDAVEAAFQALDDRWTFLLLREAYFGVRRFTDFRERLGISRKVLTDRLGALVASGLLERVAYQERPVRHEYRLSEKGRDLFGVIVALMRWGERWELGYRPIALRHRLDGGEVDAVLRCADCGQELGARDVDWSPTGEGPIGG